MENPLSTAAMESDKICRGQRLASLLWLTSHCLSSY